MPEKGELSKILCFFNSLVQCLRLYKFVIKSQTFFITSTLICELKVLKSCEESLQQGKKSASGN